EPCTEDGKPAAVFDWPQPPSGRSAEVAHLRCELAYQDYGSLAVHLAVVQMSQKGVGNYKLLTKGEYPKTLAGQLDSITREDAGLLKIVDKPADAMWILAVEKSSASLLEIGNWDAGIPAGTNAETVPKSNLEGSKTPKLLASFEKYKLKD